MPPNAMTLLGYLRRLAPPAAPDAALLADWLSRRDEGAFAALVARHGPMVLGVCRRILGDRHHAEDVFQATFLVLARQAVLLRRPEALASYLYSIAVRLARKSRGKTHRRPFPTGPDAPEPIDPHPDPLDVLSGRELLSLLDEEVARLPQRYRLPLLLCVLQERTVEETAHLLGWTAGSVRGRLARGRERLRQRLARRGVTLSAGVATALLAPAGARADVPAALAESTVRVAAGLAAATARAAALAQGGGHAVAVVPWKIGIVLFLAAGVALAGALAGGKGDPPPEAEPPTRPEGERRTRPEPPPDPLPPGAVGRLGSARLRHAAGVRAIAFAPDGRTLVSGGWDNTIRFWDLATGRERDRLPGPKRGLLGIALTPDGKALVTVGNGGSIRIREQATGRELRSWQGHGGSHVRCVAVSPDGKLLATGGGGNHDPTLSLWDLATGTELHSPGGKTYTINSVAFSPDGKVLAAGCGTLDWFGPPPAEDRGVGGTVRLWDVATGKLLKTLRGHANGVTEVAFSPDGKRLASAGNDSTLRLWDAATGKELARIPVPASPPFPSYGRPAEIDQGGVYSVKFSPDGRTLASAGEDGVVRLWDAATGKESRTLPAHGHEVRVVAFSADGKTLASGSCDNTVRLWDPRTGKELLPQPGHAGGVHCLACSPDGKYVASAGIDRTVRLWDRATGRERHLLRGHTDMPSWLAFSPDGKRLASASWDETVRIWDVERGREVHRLEHPGRALGVAFSPDGAALAALFSRAMGSGSAVYFWDPRTGKEQPPLRFVPQAPAPLQVNPDGKVLTAGDFRFGPAAPGPLQFSPDGKVLAGGDNGRVRLLEASTGKEVGAVECTWLFALSPDGRTLLTRDNVAAAQLWDVASGRRRYAFGREEKQWPFALSPDGRVLVRATMGDEVQLWEVATGRERLRWPGHENEVMCAAFSPDGRSLYTGGQDSSILCWDVAGWGRPPSGTLSAREARALWEDLAGDDAARAGRAIAALAAAPGEALPLVPRDVRPAAALDAKHLTRLVARLDHDQFEVRQSAMQELEEQGEMAEPILRDTRTGQPSPEVRRRVEELLAKLEAPLRASGRLRDLRAVELLERADTPEARRLLEALARGAPGARLTREAKASLRRLDLRLAPDR